MLHQPILAAIRAALCERIDEAAIRAQRRASAEVSLPSALLSAALYLTAHGQAEEDACAGEIFFAWSPRAYRRYLDALTPAARDAELAAGYRVIFEGRASRAPLAEGCVGQCDGYHRHAA